jgi:hypothetical protein
MRSKTRSSASLQKSNPPPTCVEQLADKTTLRLAKIHCACTTGYKAKRETGIVRSKENKKKAG